MFKHFKRKSRLHAFVYHLLTGLAIVTFWRGVWAMLDMYLLPETPFLSYMVSIVVGLLILFFNDYSIEEIGE